MKKIVVIADTLNTGGITTFLINLVNFLSNEDYEITLCYVEDKFNVRSKLNKNVSFQRIKVISNKELILKSVFNGIFIDFLKIKFRKKKNVHPIRSIQRMNRLKMRFADELVGQFDIAISSSEFFCNDYLVNKVNSKKKIGWIHPHYGSLNPDIKFDKETLDYLDHIVTVSEQSKESIVEFFPNYCNKVIHIPNLLDYKLIKNMANFDIYDFQKSSTGLSVITVSRLDNSSKRIDRQIQACKILTENGIDIKWYVIGNGNDRDYLSELVRKYKLDKIFIFLGEKENPYPYIKMADVFVLSSQYEGQPIVVDEAQIIGTPVIVSNYASAKKQVSSNYGVVLENEDEKFIQNLATVLADNQIISQLRRNITYYKYDDQTIKKLLLSLLD